MSDLGFAMNRSGGEPGDGGGFRLLDRLNGAGGFRPDQRYGGEPVSPQRSAQEPAAPEEEPDAPDPVSQAYSDGFAAGFEQAARQAEIAHDADTAAREGLRLAIARLDGELEERLRLRLRETVAALCESAIAPLALDRDGLTRRIARAVAMLQRADDERVIRLHPEDLALVSPRLASEWTVREDPRMERGTIRVETASGGVEDGPATWRQAITEALHDC
ncbi:FliH/SctL family protein [Novosphingobium aureum]|nr:FliH/SctL family protein [Novosphingobium aureum]